MLLSFVPTIDTFGSRDEFGVLLVCLLADARPGAGIWIALIGLLLIGTGSNLNLFGNLAASQSIEEDREWD